MGFDITYGSIGLFGGILIVFGLIVVVMAISLLLSASRDAREEIAEDTHHDIEA